MSPNESLPMQAADSAQSEAAGRRSNVGSSAVKNNRRERLINLVSASDLFGTAAPKAQALFVADAVTRRADGEFINRHPSEAFPGHIKNTLQSVGNRQAEQILCGCTRPTQASTGYELPMFVLETCMADQPFIIDTIKMALRRLDVHTLGTLNMILPIERDVDGKLVDLSQDNPRSKPESFSCHLLSSATVGDRRQLVRDTVRWHLTRAQLIASDFRPMRKLVRNLITDLRYCGESVANAADVAEAIEFAEWLIDENFVLMGAYGFDSQFRHTGRLGLARDIEAGIGIEGEPAQAFTADAPMVSIHQSRIPSPIHREAPLCEVRLRLLDEEGNPAGGVVFQGLFTYKAVTGRASTVPGFRNRLASIVANEDLVPASHRMKLFLSFVDRLPLTFLFSATDNEIASLINESIDVDFGGLPRVFYRVNALGTGAQVFVSMSQARYGEEVRARIETSLQTAMGADDVRFRLLVGKTDTIILDFLLFADRPLRQPGADSLTESVLSLVSPWLETMRETLRGQGVGEVEIDRLCLLFGEALPEAYRSRVDPAHLLQDLQSLDSVRQDGKAVIVLRADHQDSAENTVRLLTYGSTDTALTDILPVLDNFGLRVLGETTWKILDGEGNTSFMETYRIAADSDNGPQLLAHGDAFVEALHAVLDGRMNSTSLNKLLLPATLTWRQLQMMRAYLGYARQLGTAFPQNLVQTVLLNQPAAVRTLVDLFNARFEPRLDGASDVVSARSPQRAGQVKVVHDRFVEQLRSVQDAVEDKVLRMFANFVMATLRTNFFQRIDEARGLSFKFRCADVELMPEPRPMFEIWVYDPRVEGIHLRGGKVARGGLRWSDRIDDFRTEILGLMQTQMVKNTLIVPVGSKGGFVLKKPERDDRARRKQADELYKVFISGLFDVTDNYVNGKAVFPSDVVVYDEADPYLVVAADKGTAHLSDTANAISLARGFWLGDAFASGGSKGYDHKAYGITAKGGWVCVQRHFREMGVDIQTEPFTVFGIGDMSGDVFGNGMLLSEVILLKAAFDHRHIFLDPNPDAASSFTERKRLFDTPNTSWASYNTALISKGGGVFPRTAKSIPLSPQVRAMLETEREELSGEELMRAILLMKVDLFWNGGIGTFVKASHETHADVGDRTNDSIRLDANELRCKVVGEGGNLGFTHAARVEFALHGGRLNTDAVDNSAGVDMSDHEVNLKILFAPLMQSGAVGQPERDEALLAIDQYVCELVTYNNYQQSLGISVAQQRSAQQMRAWGDTIKFLVDQLGIDQQVQLLPSKQTVADRRKVGLGLTRPELARLTAFAKMWVFNELSADRNSSQGLEQQYLDYYFPERIRGHYADAIAKHMLRHEIVSTLWANEIVDFGSALLIPRLVTEFGRPTADICRVYTATVQLLGLPALRKQITALDAKVPAHVQYEALATLEDAAASATHWLLSTFPGDKLFDVLRRSADIKAFAQQVGDVLVKQQTAARKAAAIALASAWQAQGLPVALANQVVAVQAQAHVFAAWWLAQEAGVPAESAVAVYLGTAEVTGLDELLFQVAEAPAQNRWEVAALSSLGQGLGYTLYQLAVKVAQSLAGGKVGPNAVRTVLEGEMKLGPMWELAHQIQAEGVQIPALVVLTEKLRARLR